LSTPRKTLAFGPAYIDRVLKVDRPLFDSVIIDRSATGRWEAQGSDLWIAGLPEGDLRVEPPDGWPGPIGVIRVGEQAAPARDLIGVSWHEDLGGMGAGYAKALGGILHLLLGGETEPIGRRVIAMLDREAIAHRVTHDTHRIGEWTLLLTSGEFGDKLPIGFRDPGTHGAPAVSHEPCDLLVAASMTNRRASAALANPDARVRLFAPAMRNMTDANPKVSSFAKDVDILCCNRTEWESLADREEAAWRVSILVVTDGPRGAEVRYTDPNGDAGLLAIPAFPRREPPKDTNRAGEAFASTLVGTLLDGGWSPGTTAEGLIRLACERASAAAGLTIGRVDFGFPAGSQIDRAVREGTV
jgi:ribokinase